MEGLLQKETGSHHVQSMGDSTYVRMRRGEGRGGGCRQNGEKNEVSQNVGLGEGESEGEFGRKWACEKEREKVTNKGEGGK